MKKYSNLNIRKAGLLLVAFYCASMSLKAQQLDQFIKKALANNPNIQQFELQYKRASEKINEVNTLPNTAISMGYFVSEPETRTGAQRFRVSAKQMLPWFGTITARENYVSALAEATYEDIVIAKRNLVAEVSKVYYNLYANSVQQVILMEHIQLLKTYETLALKAVETGKASVVSVLRLQMRQNELQQLKDILAQQYLTAQTKMNILLNQPKETRVLVITSLQIPKEDFIFDTANLRIHPEVVKYDKLYASVTQLERLNQKESNPMIGFGLDYVAVSERPNMSFNDNGKDIIMPMVSLSIPIFNKKHKSKTQQNKLQQEEIESKKQERLNTLETLLSKAINERIVAKISYATQTKNLQQAKDAAEILIKSYETGTIDFKEVLDIQELQLKFQMNQIASVKTYYLQSTIINYLIQQ